MGAHDKSSFSPVIRQVEKVRQTAMCTNTFDSHVSSVTLRTGNLGSQVPICGGTRLEGADETVLLFPHARLCIGLRTGAELIYPHPLC